MRKNYIRTIDKKMINDFNAFLNNYGFTYKKLFSIKSVKYSIAATDKEITIIDYYIRSCELCNM